jgi:hypothetical protein
MKKIGAFWLKVLFVAMGVGFIRNLLLVGPPYLHFKPIQVQSWILWVTFFALLFLTGPTLKLIRWALVIGVLTPMYYIGMETLAKKMGVHMDYSTVWLFRTLAISLAGTTYFYGWQLIKFLTHKFFWYMFAPLRFLSKKIGPTFKFLWRKVKKLPPCPIDLPLSAIDKFGNGDTYEKGRQFEEYIAQLYRVMGYNAKTTTQLRLEGKLPPSIQSKGGSGEQGVDVVVPVYNQQSGVEEKIIIQCKHYSQKVENKAVQEIHTAKAMYNGHLAVVITNNYFTQQAKDLAAANGVLLIDRDELSKLIEKATKKYYAQNHARKSQPGTKLVA